MEQGKWSRRLWAVNGVVLLVFLSVLLVMLAVERFGRGDSYREVPVEVSAAPSRVLKKGVSSLARIS